MTPVHWTWAAVTAQVGLLFSPLLMSNSWLAFSTVVLTHAAICAVAALATYLLLPGRFRKPRLPVTLLMFCFAFIAPVVVAVGLLLITRTNLHKTLEETSFAVPVPVELPVYDVQSKDQYRGGQGAIRSRLGHEVPSDLRMQSLLTLQAVPNRVSNPILEDLLGDDTDDVRLVAFGMLDSEEKKISSQIRRENDRLTAELPVDQRFDCLRHLAELHWELVYACLAQGELRQHILAQAAGFADAALALDALPSSGLRFLRGRIYLAQGEMNAAEQAILRAVALGEPKTSAWPYLAEIAFRRRDFAEVRRYMEQISAMNLASRTRAVEDFWVNRDKETFLSDHRYLPHI